MEKCERCKNYVFEKCNCQLFIIIDEDEETHEVYANTEETAALEFARQYNEDGEYLLMNETMVININDNKYCVGAEPDVHYSCKKL